MTAMQKRTIASRRCTKKNGDTLMMRRYLEVFLERARGVPYLQEQVRTTERLLDR